jgi:hypothetical protein
MKLVYGDNSFLENQNTIYEANVEHLCIKALGVIVAGEHYSTTRRVLIQLTVGGKCFIEPSSFGACKERVEELAKAYKFEVERKRAEKCADVFAKLEAEQIGQ